MKQTQIHKTIVVRPPQRTPQDISKWRNAMRSADYGRVAQLVELYDDLLIDPVLGNAVEKRIMAITNAELVFSKNNKNVPQIDDLIDTPEFEELLREILLSKFYPKTVIEFDFTNGFNAVSIDRRHFNTKDKIILKSLSDTEGIPYESNDFLLSLGKERDLGLFLKTAPYAIFKRNGMGDFAEYCELFGIDTLVGLYDPEDENGRVEMEQAFAKRGGSGSMTMSKNNDVKTIGTKSTGTVDIHERFANKCDEQILIAILGQTMTTKDGSSYSQGAIHAQTEDDINKADRRFVQRILNTELLPRLAKRGYDVAGGWFHFAEQGENLSKLEQLTIAERVNAIVPIDENYWYETFGVPKPSREQKQEPSNKEQEPSKKEQETSRDKTPFAQKVAAKNLSVWERMKDFFFDVSRLKELAVGFRPSIVTLYEELNWEALEREYEQLCCEKHQVNLSVGDSSWADELAKLWIAVLQYVYQLKKVPNELINRDVVTLQAQMLIEPIERIFQDVEWDSPDYVLREILKKNMWDFSVAKNYNDLVAVNNLLLKEDGSLRPWYDFKHEAQKVVGRSIRYLKTEYNTVVSAAQMSGKWQEIQRDKHLFPYVQFKVIVDGHTSDICKPLHDVIVSVDDPMLMYYFPPNHFNCRTTVIRLRRATPTAKYDLPKIPDAFKNNPAVSGRVFTDKHRYFLNVPDEVRLFGKALKEQTEFIEKRRAEFEKLLANKDYLDVAFDEKTGGLKATHRLHNFDKVTGKYEKEAQNILFGQGHSIILEKELADKGERIIDGVKHIDGTLDSIPMDISTIKGTGNDTIKRALKHSIEKKAKIAILYYTENTFNLERLHVGIRKFNGLKIGKFERIIYIVEDKVHYL